MSYLSKATKEHRRGFPVTFSGCEALLQRSHVSLTHKIEAGAEKHVHLG